jgi:hypothetical protein
MSSSKHSETYFPYWRNARTQDATNSKRAYRRTEHSGGAVTVREFEHATSVPGAAAGDLASRRRHGGNRDRLHPKFHSASPPNEHA